MKHRFSRQPRCSAEHKRGVFPVHFLRRDSQTPVTDHSVLTMHLPVTSKEGASPCWTPLLEAQEVTSKDALTYTFLTKRTSAECLKTCRCQNGTIQHTRCICTTNNSCTKVQVQLESATCSFCTLRGQQPHSTAHLACSYPLDCIQT